MSIISTRQHQIFPVLTAAQIETAKRFASGDARIFAAGASLYSIGESGAPAWLVLEGSIDVVRRDGLDREALVTTHGVGQLSGEVNQLSGRPSIASGRAGAAGCTALPFDPAHLRALMVGSADVGETIMRALILRRVALIEDGGAGTILIGTPGHRDVTRLQEFLARSGYPNLLLDAASSDEGKALIERTGVLPAELPLVVCPSGTILKHPTESELATCLGMMPALRIGQIYDVAIVGAGPSGLAAAVYASSEGLSVIVLDERTIGGQAGASSRIENYLGFPTGISGQALAGRAFNQAIKFGAEIAVPLGASRLDCPEGHQRGQALSIKLQDGQVIQARTTIIASGARYRRPEIPNLAEFEGAGVSYWASPIEAKLCEGEEISLVGGGNSAGQAVVFLATRVKHLHLIVRRDLAETMSRYLIDRIDSLPNITVHVGSHITALHGSAATGLTGITHRDREGLTMNCDTRHLFLFIGADPNANWLKGCVDTDEKGFVITGKSDLLLETSMPGVFAIGDVRAGSTKRVSAAVGEGAAVVAQIHSVLSAIL